MPGAAGAFGVYAVGIRSVTKRSPARNGASGGVFTATLWPCGDVTSGAGAAWPSRPANAPLNTTAKVAATAVAAVAETTIARRRELICRV
ncbi:hypothetical protein GCM10009845_07280 [Pedococcus bigeumensis]